MHSARAQLSRGVPIRVPLYPPPIRRTFWCTRMAQRRGRRRRRGDMTQPPSSRRPLRMGISRRMPGEDDAGGNSLPPSSVFSRPPCRASSDAPFGPLSLPPRQTVTAIPSVRNKTSVTACYLPTDDTSLAPPDRHAAPIIQKTKIAPRNISYLLGFWVFW